LFGGGYLQNSEAEFFGDTRAVGQASLGEGNVWRAARLFALAGQRLGFAGASRGCRRS